MYGQDYFTVQNVNIICLFHSKMRGVTDMNDKEVLMEYVAYLLHIGDNKEAMTVMQVHL